jgi:uncharacterized protein YndB with AHSA1/START domain
VIELEEAVVVRRPRAAVFALLEDVAAFPSWLPAIREAALLDPPPVRAGSRIRLALEGPAGPMDAAGEITDLRAPDTLAFRTVKAPVDLEARCTLEALDPGTTRLRLAIKLSLPGMLRFAEGMVRKRIAEERAATVDDLRARLEAAIRGS